MRAIKTMVMLLGLTSWAWSGYAQTNLPFSDNFDSLDAGEDLIENDAWSFNIAPKGTNGTPDSSTRALYSADELTLSIDDSFVLYSNVWWHGYAKVRTHSTEPDIDGAAAAFYVNTGGELKAYSNSTYVTVATGIQTNNWIGFAVHLDYDQECWDLYMTYTHGATLTKQNAAPLAFNHLFANPDGEISSAVVSGETYLDAIAVAATSVSVVPGDESPEITASPSETALTLNDLLSGAALQYFSGGTGTLAGPFGEALGSLLVNGDKVHVYDGVNQNWITFTFNGQIFSPTEEAASTVITMTTGLSIELAGSGDRMNSFFVAYDSTAPSSVAAMIHGNGDWNLLALPFPAGSKSIVGNSDFFDFAPAVGDRIFLRRGGQWVALRYSSLNRWVRFGTQAANETFPAGSGFWYQRAGGDANWTSF